MGREPDGFRELKPADRRYLGTNTALSRSIGSTTTDPGEQEPLLSSYALGGAYPSGHPA